MIDYFIKLKVKSAFLSKITGDQLNGGFLYFLSLKDRDFFNLLYDLFIKNKPPFLFSSIFPSGYLPINANFLIKEILAGDLDREEQKKIKKIEYLPIEFFSGLKENRREILNQKEKKLIYSSSLTKISLKNKTLFNQKIYQIEKKEVDIFLRLFDDSLEKYFQNNLDEFFSFFVGKRVSVGFCNFELLELKKYDLKKIGSFFINLSPFVPKENEKQLYQPLDYEFFIKYPKAGILTGGRNPFKKKIIMIKEGSVFQSKTDNEILYFGTILKSVSFSFPQLIQPVLSFGYFFNL